MSDRIKALQQTPMFGGLGASDLEALAGRGIEQSFQKGEIVFIAGEPAGGLYVVIRGAIRAYRVSPDGREQVIHVERSGSTLAEVPVFDAGPYPSTAAAEEDSTLLFIRREDVLQLCRDRPAISLAALKLLAGRLRSCAAKVESLSLRDVDRRLGQFLLELASDRTQSPEFDLDLTHQQIAARIGSVREVVSRAFQRLQQSGLIRVNGRRISVPNREALEHYVSG